MSEQIIVAIIAALPPTVGIVVGVILAVRRIREVGADVRQVGTNVEAVHISVNSRLSELLEQTRRASHAAGVEANKQARENEEEGQEP